MRKYIGIVACCITSALLLYGICFSQTRYDPFFNIYPVVTASAATTAQTPQITAQPAGGTVYVGEVVTMTVTAQVTDGGALS